MYIDSEGIAIVERSLDNLTMLKTLHDRGIDVSKFPNVWNELYQYVDSSDDILLDGFQAMFLKEFDALADIEVGYCDESIPNSVGYEYMIKLKSDLLTELLNKKDINAYINELEKRIDWPATFLYQGDCLYFVYEPFGYMPELLDLLIKMVETFKEDGIKAGIINE
ncbi:hypothetical protein [Desertibacillus haloalkaliphilus]|uniref:hypothetical protein n=1 Tax=Desertibacillus haloalkaliphilus TaxID=1328930 RepID=UPI001C2677D9|nr:hypothetical protein [Desertibacillus haloalkaliphilus]MBU8908081.1 hypothetical protein [Desertibacillus haloalkaliphilus]